MALAVNTQAPLFTLKQRTDDGFADVSLADFIGKKKVVLLFFPFAYSSVCEAELCSVSGGLDQYEALNAQVLGISVDLPFAQAAFAKSVGINFPLISDFNGEVSKAYDVSYDEILGLKGVSKRSAFVIDLDGKIVYSSASDDPTVVPSFDEIKAALQ